MSGLAFLLIPVVLTIVGSLVIWFRTRKPSRWDSGIDEFSRNMDALSPQGRVQSRSGWRRSRR